MTPKRFVLATAILAAGTLATFTQSARATEQGGAGKAAGSIEDRPLHLSAKGCADLRKLAITPSEIGLPSSGASVKTAQFIEGARTGNIDFGFCKVIGIVKPHRPGSANLEFEVNLPSQWNGRALQMGGGGYDGSLVTGLERYENQRPDGTTPLMQGYVTLGSDGGHKGKPGFDGTFGLDDEALLNYGKQSVKKTHDVAAAILLKAYGHSPVRFYFIGGSQGGHEALDAAARYPQDYDGVVAQYPAYNVTLLHISSLNVGKSLYADGGAGWINPAKTKLIGDAVYTTCDVLDGASDGIISHIAACNAAFDIASLRCQDGTDAGDTCLSDAQIQAVRLITSDYKPGVTIAGMDTFPKWPLLEGAPFQGPSNFGQVRQPSNPISGKEALLYSAGDQTVKFIVTRNPRFDAMTFDPQQWKDRLSVLGSIMDVTDVSLDGFLAKGGKVIMIHGTADDLITPHNSIAYYQRQLSRYGQDRLDSFLRFYMIPGYGHGFGKFNAKYDSLDALENWVENGRAPSGLVAVDSNPGANRSRPMCQWPAWPKFTGNPGTEDASTSFTCIRG